MASINRRLKWLKAFTDFVNGKETACPNCGSTKLIDRYIELGKVDHIGWGAFWCEECRQAFTLSRVDLNDETLRAKIIPVFPDDLKFI